MKKAMSIFLAVAASFLWIAGTSSSGTETGKTDGVEYMTGGVGIDERQQMEETAKGYNVKAIFATTSGSYLSNITITITKTSGEKVLEAKSNGPWFFAKLPQGTYSIKALYNGTEKTANRGCGTGVEIRHLCMETVNDWKAMTARNEP